MKRCLTFLAFVSMLPAEEIALRIDPAQTRIQFKLGATLHSVKGTFRLKQGNIRFDPATGTASGQLVIDAASGESGNKDRDQDMHTKVLESARFPEIVFRPARVTGKVAAEGTSKVELSGRLGIHGSEHEIVIPLVVERRGGGYAVSGSFVVPYVRWGMKNPSKALLRVSDRVEITLQAVTLPGGVR